jgi:hypothetical protein
VSSRMHIPAESAGRSRPSVSTDRITAAALKIVGTKGSRALTMRRLRASPRPESEDAVPLRSSKDAPLDGLIERVLTDLAINPLPLTG